MFQLLYWKYVLQAYWILSILAMSFKQQNLFLIFIKNILSTYSHFMIYNLYPLYMKYLIIPRSWRPFSVFFRCFIRLYVYDKSWINFCIQCKIKMESLVLLVLVGVVVVVVVYSCPIVLVFFVANTILSPLNFLIVLVKNLLTIYV